MADPLVISVDAMGGDHGPTVVAPALSRALKFLTDPPVRFLLHGDEAAITAAMARLPELKDRVEVRHADRVFAGDEKPAQAMRRGKGTSMWNAIESVKSGEAKAVVSAGNTGALMAIAKLQLRMIGDLERPALVANWPTSRGVTAVLDVGANIDCDAERLAEFAIMGAAFYRAVHGAKTPTVGLLNVGSEDEKGHEEVRGANRLLRETQFDLDYRGFVEGDDIAKGEIDVIVTDGFTGNVALKTAEGLARFFRNELRAAFGSDLMGQLGAFIAQRSLKKMRERLDPSANNGGPFLGLNGIVVKSHGGADARGFATAIRLAADLAKSDFAAEIDRNLVRLTAAAGAHDEVVETGGKIKRVSILRSVVTGVGSYLPPDIVTNDDLSKIIDTSDAWIVERTGIRSRRKAAEGVATSDLAAEAARQALLAAGRTAADVDLIIVATTTADLTFPACATMVQRKIGAPIGIAFDVQAVCSGFVYALAVADGFVARGQSKVCLVIGAETMTRLMDWTDRGTCVLFGDGAGAVVLEPGEGQGTNTDRGVLAVSLRADGSKQDLLYVDGGPSTTGTTGHLRMQGNQVFRHAVVNISEAVIAAAKTADVGLGEIDWFIPHQANQRILEGVARRLGIDETRVISTVARHANTSAASIPLAWAEACADGRIKPGQLLLVEAMGGGLTWGAAVIRL